MLRDASEQRKRLATILAFCSIPLSGFVTDIYLPSFPAMAKGLMVSEQDIQLTLTCYLLSYGISQVFIGSLLDNIGRYKPRLFALALLVFTNIGITYLDNVFYICLMRIIQGMAISTLVVATRAIFMDIYDDEKRQYYLSYFTVVWSCGPILAPFLGGYLEKLFNWHANFYFLAGYAGVLLLLDLLISGESIPEKKKFKISETFDTFKLMLGNKFFMNGTLILGLSYSIVMVFNISGPFLIENIFNQNSVVIGYCTLILGFAWMLGGIIGKRRMHLPFKPKVLKPSVSQIILILLLLSTTLFIENLTLLIAFLFLIHTCSGTLFNNFFTTTMLQFPNNAGTAGGLMGGLVYIITSFTTLVVSSTGTIDSSLALSIRYFILSFFLLLAILYIIKIYRKENI
ncbi:MAG: MFS transporter [Flavobacteriaceae bacterium]|jgi:MFS family permease|nr:MFS transporter [Flavobacteriaceae bacterium]